jgi:hypothetical protein
VPNSVAPTLSVCAPPRRGRGAHDRLDEVLDREELVAVVPVAEDVDPAALADPVEEDLEDAEPLRPDERLRADDRRLDARRPDTSASASIFDSPYQPTPTSGSSSSIGCFSGHAVDGSRRDEDDPRDAGLARGLEHVLRAVDVDRRIDSREAWIGSAAAAWTTTSRPATSSATVRGRGCHRAAPDRALELRVVERSDVERADVVPVREQRRARCRPRKPAPPEMDQSTNVER